MLTLSRSCHVESICANQPEDTCIKEEQMLCEEEENWEIYGEVSERDCLQ